MDIDLTDGQTMAETKIEHPVGEDNRPEPLTLFEAEKLIKRLTAILNVVLFERQVAKAMLREASSRIMPSYTGYELQKRIAELLEKNAEDRLKEEADDAAQNVAKGEIAVIAAPKKRMAPLGRRHMRE